MCSLPAFYGIRVHLIIAQLLRGNNNFNSKLNFKYRICEKDIEKISTKLSQFIDEMKFTNPRIEYKLSTYNVHGRCDAIFTSIEKNCDIIIDWKYNQKIKPPQHIPETKDTTIIQLNIYRALYMEIFNKDCDIAVVYVNYSKKYGNFKFQYKPIEKFDICYTWGLINMVRQKSQH